MSVKITAKNHGKIEDAIRAANGKARERLMYLCDVISLAEGSEKRLEKLGIPKAKRAGAKAFWYEANLPNAYKYRTEATRIDIERRPTGWFLCSAQRVQIWPGESTVQRVELSEEQYTMLRDRLPRTYSV